MSCWLTLAPGTAWAALGGDTVSILADQGQMRGTRQAISHQAYVIHEIRSEDGVVVREYQGAQGTVFAVAWQGRWMPDMRQILGSYYDRFARAMTSRAGVRGRHPVSIDEPDLVIQIGGHPQSFVGKAYLPGTLPETLRPEDIR